MNSIKSLLVELGICEEKSIVAYYPKVRDRDDISVQKCLKSGVIFLDRSDHMDLSHYQSKDGFCYWGAKDRKAALTTGFEDDKRRFEQFRSVVSNKKWLDIGTGAGGILDLLSPLAAETMAVEPQESVRNYLIEAGYNVFDAVDSVAVDGIEIVTMFHVFEHLTDPVGVLESLRKKMAKKAKIIIEVPHARDFLLSFLNIEEFKSFTFWSEHLILHTRDSLKIFLEKSGFNEVAVVGHQRYPLANHLHWLSEGKPGGHVVWDFLRTETLDSAYGDMLSRIDCTDTLIAFATNE